MIQISICICTRNRQEGLKKLLESLENMKVTNNIKVKLIIVENDIENYSENTVKEFTSKSKFSVNYYLETNKGLAYARNRSVKEACDCDFCCFIDDDQVVASDWLVQLLKCQREFDADGVWGPNPPIFNDEVHPSIKRFYMPTLLKYGTIVKYAYTNCLLLRKEFLDKIEGPFDIRLNFTGGEDNYLTWLFTNNGGVIRYNPHAVAYEIIPKSREKIQYILKRKFRISNEGLFIETIKDNKFSKWNALPRLILRLCYGLLIVIPCLLFGKVNKLKGLLKISDALGGFYFILGRKNQFYKKTYQAG